MNCQKIELEIQFGSLMTKELKKKHSFILVGGVETGSWGGEDLQQGMAGGLGQARWWLVDRAVPHLPVNKLRGTTGE